MEKRLFGIRGAVFVASNTKEEIIKAVEMLFSLLFAQNPLETQDVVSIQFTTTKDLTAFNPATALRNTSHSKKLSTCALFCAQEPDIVDASVRTIRTLVTVYLPEGSVPSPVFTNGAEALRPDLFGKK